MAESQEKAPRGPGLVVRLSADEREAWHAAAQVDGYRQTARWVREVVQAHMTGEAVRVRRREGSVPVEVLAALGKIGSNVNQLAHRANAAALNSEPFPVAVAELESVRRELAALREALGVTGCIGGSLLRGPGEPDGQHVRLSAGAQVQDVTAVLAGVGQADVEAVLRPGDPGYKWTGQETDEDFERFGSSLRLDGDR